jgi:hypothetical protein
MGLFTNSRTTNRVHGTGKREFLSRMAPWRAACALRTFRTKAWEKSPGGHIHLDADTLAAFAEGVQGKEDRRAVLAHLAECEICRDYLAAHAELKEFDWHAARAGVGKRFRPAPGPDRVATVAAMACAMAVLSLRFFTQPAGRNVTIPARTATLAHIAQE